MSDNRTNLAAIAYQNMQPLSNSPMPMPSIQAPSQTYKLSPLHQKSHSQKISFIQNEYFGKIGWGVKSPNLNSSPLRVVIDDQPHKQFFDRERNNMFTKVQGVFSNHVDKKLGISLEAFHNLDMRSLRILIKQKVWQQQNKMKHVFLNKSQSRSQTTGGKLTYDDGKKGTFNYASSNYANGSIIRTPNAQDKADINNDLVSPNMMSSFLDKSLNYPNNTRASIKEVNADQENDSYLLSSPLGHLPKNTSINTKYRMHSVDQVNQLNFENESEINQSKVKCPKLMKMIDSQSKKLQEMKTQSLKKKKFYDNQHRQVLHRSNNVSIDYYDSKPTQYTQQFVSFSKTQESHNPLPSLKNNNSINHSNANSNSIQYRSKQVNKSGDPSVDFRIQQQRQIPHQMINSMVSNPYNQVSATQDTKSLKKILHETSNQNSQATNISHSFLNNSTQRDMYEISRVSSKVNHFGSLHEIQDEEMEGFQS
ncbi:UNKNOWN [Stylonychia lemnae]|uniref:Uncharacterized protein n=1 Tax=Stylonychia lemnae TaxID=5949 RepID=A0A078ALX8_STYLE|nr:UNKNOWN [Stylonychia lemnae]|eukprot:CDW83239.1 UNKNOWN [Stylonychia lemnae]